MRRLEVLDSFRGIFALLVAIMHLQVAHSYYYNPFVRHSYLFVDFFFVLSGFVISLSSEARLGKYEQNKIFIIRRFGRIYPLHLFILFIFFIFQIIALGAASSVHLERPPFTYNFSWGSLLANLVLLQSFGIFDHATWNAPSWSIAAEFWTYVVFVLAVTFSGRYLPAVAILLLAFSAIMLTFAPKHIDSTYDFGFYRCVLGFFTGVLLTRARTWSLSSRAISSTIEITAVLTSIAYVAYWPEGYLSVCSPLIFAAVIYIFSHQAGIVSDFLKSRPFLFLGELSYTIYMVNSIFFLIIFRNGARVFEQVFHIKIMSSISYAGEQRPIVDLGSAVANNILLLVYIGLVIIASFVTYHLVEKPARDYIYGLARRSVKSGNSPALSQKVAD